MKFFISLIITLNVMQAMILIGDNSVRAKGMGGAFTAIAQGPDVSYYNSAYHIDSIDESLGLVGSMIGPMKGHYFGDETSDSRLDNLEATQLFNIQTPFFFGTSQKMGYQGVALYNINNTDLSYIDMVKGFNFSLAMPIIEDTFFIGATIRFPDSFSVNNYSVSALYSVFDQDDFSFLIGANTNNIDHSYINTLVTTHAIYKDYAVGASLQYITDLGVLSLAYDYRNEQLQDGASAKQSIDIDAFGLEIMGDHYGFRTGYYKTRENSLANIEAYTIGMTSIFDFKTERGSHHQWGFDLAYEYRTSVLSGVTLYESQLSWSWRASLAYLLSLGIEGLLKG